MINRNELRRKIQHLRLYPDSKTQIIYDPISEEIGVLRKIDEEFWDITIEDPGERLEYDVEAGNDISFETLSQETLSFSTKESEYVARKSQRGWPSPRTASRRLRAMDLPDQLLFKSMYPLQYSAVVAFRYIEAVSNSRDKKARKILKDSTRDRKDYNDVMHAIAAVDIDVYEKIKKKKKNTHILSPRKLYNSTRYKYPKFPRNRLGVRRLKTRWIKRLILNSSPNE